MNQIRSVIFYGLAVSVSQNNTHLSRLGGSSNKHEWKALKKPAMFPATKALNPVEWFYVFLWFTIILLTEMFVSPVECYTKTGATSKRKHLPPSAICYDWMERALFRTCWQVVVPSRGQPVTRWRHATFRNNAPLMNPLRVAWSSWSQYLSCIFQTGTTRRWRKQLRI